MWYLEMCLLYVSSVWKYVILALFCSSVLCVYEFFILKFMDSPFMLHSGRAECLMQSQLGKFLGCATSKQIPETGTLLLFLPSLKKLRHTYPSRDWNCLSLLSMHKVALSFTVCLSLTVFPVNNLLGLFGLYFKSYTSTQSLLLTVTFLWKRK